MRGFFRSFAWVWLGEVLTLIALFGGALVIGGVLLVNVLGKRQQNQR